MLDAILTLTAERKEKKTAFDEKAHHELARKAAAQSAVLLKNTDQILPLKAGTKVAVIGDFAITPRYQGAGSSMVNATKVDTIEKIMNDCGLQIVVCPAAIRGTEKWMRRLKRKPLICGSRRCYYLLLRSE